MFGKKTAEDVLKLFSQLPDEEKAKVLDGLKKPDTEDEEQVAEAEEHIEERGEEDGTKDQTAQDVEDESVGEQEKLDGNEDSQTAKDRIDESEGTQAYDEAKEDAKEDERTEENRSEVLEGLTSRVSAIEEALKELNSLKEQMKDYAAKNAERFGYKGTPFGAKKSMDDMSADELKNEILHG